ncbi:MAG: hypothetical protein LBM65_05310 [Oscillospiraceae bacterium]|jgi:hypothetical protein|nr:hypothetical protein [Oscillospiraceae bacterium]
MRKSKKQLPRSDGTPILEFDVGHQNQSQPPTVNKSNVSNLREPTVIKKESGKNRSSEIPTDNTTLAELALKNQDKENKREHIRKLLKIILAFAIPFFFLIMIFTLCLLLPEQTAEIMAALSRIKIYFN